MRRSDESMSTAMSCKERMEKTRGEIKLNKGKIGDSGTQIVK